MRPEIRLAILVVAISLPPLTATHAAEVAVCTSMGAMTVETFDEESPLHAAHFLEYVDRGYYAGTVFHRVIDGFMIQAGGYDQSLRAKETRGPIANESRNGLSNIRGTLAAARTADPDSADAQFFINVVDNARLDARPGAPGYTVFGRVTSGMDVADAIAKLPTRALAPFSSDVPNPLVAIRSMARLDEQALAGISADERETELRTRIAGAVTAENPAEVLEWLNRYRANCATMDADLLMTEAETSASLLRVARAQSALDEYFSIAGNAHPDYDRALALYAQVAPDAQPRVEQAFGNCSSPTRPEIPSGNTASMDEMVEGQAKVRAFMNAGDSYIECLSAIINEEADSDEQEARIVEEHNRMVDVMEDLAEAFNAQIRAFRERD